MPKKLYFVFIIFGSLTFSLLASDLMTKELWRKISLKEKDLLFSGVNIEKYENLKLESFDDEDAINQISDLYTKESIQKAITSFKAYASWDVSDIQAELYAIVGRPHIYQADVLKSETEIFGVALSFIQEGCMTKDPIYAIYESEAQAIAANCDFNADVSWQIWGTFNADGTVIYARDYFEWSGH